VKSSMAQQSIEARTSFHILGMNKIVEFKVWLQSVRK
jgi:hypothetical protein